MTTAADDPSAGPLDAPIEEILAEEQEPPVASRPLGLAGRLAFTGALLAVGAVLFVVVGSTAVVGVANAFGFALDSRYCSLETASSCTSVSAGEIDAATGVRLPEGAEVTESGWLATPSSARLAALIGLPEPGWTPSAAVFEKCGTIEPCSGAVPSSFAEAGVDVETEYVRRLNPGDGSTWSVVTGRDAADREWVSIEYTLVD